MIKGTAVSPLQEAAGCRGTPAGQLTLLSSISILSSWLQESKQCRVTSHNN